MANILLVANDEFIKEVYSILSEEINIIRKQNILFIINRKNKVISKILLNEYETIVNLKLPRKYGYLNNYILFKLMGLVYKNETTNN